MKVNKTLFRWSRLLHIYAAITLLFVLGFFAITGITLNHADWFVGSGSEREVSFQLEAHEPMNELKFSPAQISAIEDGLGVSFSQLSFELDEDFALIDAQRPGLHLSGEIDLFSGDVSAVVTHYGMWAVMNDLHKGRHTGWVWSLSLDFFAVLTLVFCISGLVLILPNKRYLNASIYLSLFAVGASALIISYT